MANVSIQRSTPWTGQWDPLRRMRELLQWDPFREMTTVPMPETPSVFLAAFDVKETKDAYVFRADLPGVKEKDLEISLSGDQLTISGRRESEEEQKNDTYYAYERSFGSFTRAFTLPSGADAEHATAELKEGVLTLSLPKKPEAKAQKIPIGLPKGKA